ncbi:two-component system response regulator [Herminiimonas fonticola]|uniref:Diguanylate cyclase (GGDEF)-like protein n=1 Tax=Herminiimonas fonticola TaxID=303380 RepID=A0A4R6G6E5_9BURK|nr:EAL domain-containing protein [Herminiimonas fonticola]RBA24067.1 GGDEF: diguanylate cyclase (GGDEF) domain [Herminiimonas fonticola]TDN90066.1 diguanylate cyclase (GGDEF)-like protein [Herminiimonas fonticola]
MSKSVSHSEDDLVFLDEAATPSDNNTLGTSKDVWQVMIIDDDADVHSATTFALSNVEIQNRPLSFLHAYSAQQARAILANEPNVAVILLDVVMEQQDEGLQLVHYIRDVLHRTEVRIILRTGQPGYAPEIDAIQQFDINDYKTKSELTRIKLYTVVTAAIRSYEQICTINSSSRGLDMILRASTELMALQTLEEFTNGVLRQISHLLDIQPNGLFCVRETLQNQDTELFVVAAAGKYRNLLNHSVSTLEDEQIGHALRRALNERRNIYGREFTALHFGGNAINDFAAFFHIDRPLNDTALRLLEVFCSNISVGLANIMLVTNLHNSAFYDSLTKLPNRTRLKEIIDDNLISTTDKPTTLALIDIDHFAETNDTLGHQFGDLLLLSVASRLQSRLGDRLVVARVGGDTFGVLGDDIQVNPAAVLAQFERPFSIDGQDVQLSATVGLVRLSEHEGRGVEALKNAHIALKRAKLQQRTGYLHFSRSMGIDIRERVNMMHALRAAFEERHLFVVYQPQIDMVTRLPVGAEALLRWQTEDKTMISPSRFIPIAEYSGLIIELGEWVLRQACQELVRIQRHGFPNFMMSVNVSQVQFRHPHFLSMLRKALEDTNAPPHCIELEITESMAMEEPDALIKLLDQITETGVSIAIDDFGTGFSSLSHLQKLSVDRLKIDRAFVMEITDSSRGSSIAEMIIQLGRNLELDIIAEGVEDERQAKILTELGCPYGQGYLFSKPLTSDALHDWLRTHKTT